MIRTFKEVFHKAGKHLLYLYKLALWRQVNRWRRLKFFLKKNFGLTRRVLFVLIGLGIGLLVNYFGEGNFTQDILSGYLFAAGAMTGSIIVIVFTISIFLLQSAANLYSSQFFEVYIHDWKEKLVYFIVSAIAIIYFGAGIYFGSVRAITEFQSTFLVPTSLALMGIVFALVDWQYKNVRGKINPSVAIVFLEREALRFIGQLQSDAETMADIIHMKNESSSKEMTLAATYNRFLQPYINNLDRQLENLVEISMKLSDKQEVQTTKRGFTAIHNIIARFFEARKHSSVVVPSGIAFLAIESDSQQFLSRNFERLNKAGEKFIKEGRSENATYIIDVYSSLANKAKEIQFVGKRNENPILENLTGFLEFYIEVGKRAKDVEVVFQGTSVLGNIAVISADKGLQAQLLGIQENILKNGIFGVSEKHTVIVDVCTRNYLNIIGAVFASKHIAARHQFSASLKHIADLSGYTFNLIKSGYLPDNFTTRMSVSKGYDELFEVIAQIANYYSKLAVKREKNSYIKDLVDLFKEINRSLRTLSESIKNSDSTLVDSVGRLLFNANDLMLEFADDPEFKEVRQELMRHLTLNIHLPDLFIHHAEKFDGGSNPFNTLTDSIAKTGILIFQKDKNSELITDCINSLSSITSETIEKTTSRYGYDEPRVLEKACYLGILALKHDVEEVLIEVALKIREFEPKYFSKYFRNLPADIDPEDHNVIGLPQKDQLYIELLRWRNDSIRIKGIGRWE